MKSPEEIIASLEACASQTICLGCSYKGLPDCGRQMKKDARDLIRSLLGLTPESPEDSPKTLEGKTTLTTIERIELVEEISNLLKSLERVQEIVNDGMTADEYQREAMRTAWTDAKENLPPKVAAMLESGAFDEKEILLLHGVMGLSGESGEAEELVKKWIFHGHDLDAEKVAEELCDVAWYLAIASRALGYKLSAIFQMNIDKRMERYPDGFDKSRSINREEEAK